MKKVFLLIAVLLGHFTISAQITANFTVNSTSGCEPLIVEFFNTSTGNITDYFWDLGNGQISFVPNPSIIYSESGEYEVWLIVSNQMDSDTAISNITVFESPNAEFITDPSVGDAPLTVDFMDLSTGNNFSYLWDFGAEQLQLYKTLVIHLFLLEYILQLILW